MHRRVNDPTRNHFLIIHHRKTNLLLNSSYRSESATLQRATTLFLAPNCSVRTSSNINELHNTRKKQGLTVTSARLPPSVPRLALRHYLRSSPVGLGTSTRLARAADSLHSVVLHHGIQLRPDHSAFYAPPGAKQSSIPDTIIS